MNFGGIQKSSLIDYPGKVCCVIFLSGCNFECPYCHNPYLVKGSTEYHPFLNDTDLYAFLESRKNFLDGVVISGGEPTLHKDLFNLCASIKEFGYPIKLDTNGSRPEKLKNLIENGLVDYIAMDIKTDPFNYDPLIKNDCNPEDLLSSILFVMKSAPAYEFRTTCVKGFVDEQIIEKIAKLIKGANLYALQQFQNAEILHPEFFHYSDSGYNKEDLIRLKSIADPWVKECVVR